MKERIAYIDLASGIMILMVLYFHALYPIWENEILNHVPWLYFFMPWFFYKSGMLFAPKETRIQGGKLLIPFVIWSFIGWLAHIIWHWYVGDLTPRIAFYSPFRSLLLNGCVPLNNALWFLPILYLVRLIGNWSLLHVKGIYVAILSLMACLLLNFIHIPFIHGWIDHICWGLFFFLCGYCSKEYEQKLWLIVVASIIYAISLIYPIHAVYGGVAPKWCQLLWYPSCAFACVLFNNMCRWVILLTEKYGTWQFPVLRYVGENAMNFYVPHYIIFALVYNIIGTHYDIWYSGWQGLLIVTIAYAILLPVINSLDRYINRVKTRK